MSTPLRGVRPTPPFDVDGLLHSAVAESTVATYQPGDVIFSQGDAADSVMYLRDGLIKLSVSSSSGKEAVIAMLEPKSFFGESALIGTADRHDSATSLTAADVLRIPKERMLSLLRDEPAFADRFMAYLLVRNSRIEEDVVDQLLNSSERRLARTLLLLAHHQRPGTPAHALPRISQQTLADMIGTTRSRVNLFLRTFRMRGYIDSRGGLTVNDSLMTVILEDATVGTRARKACRPLRARPGDTRTRRDSALTEDQSSKRSSASR